MFSVIISITVLYGAIIYMMFALSALQPGWEFIVTIFYRNIKSIVFPKVLF